MSNIFFQKLSKDAILTDCVDVEWHFFPSDAILTDCHIPKDLEKSKKTFRRNDMLGKFEIYKEKLEKPHSVGMFRSVKKTLGKENNKIGFMFDEKSHSVRNVSFGKFEICKGKLEKPHSVRNVSFGKIEICKEKLEKPHSVRNVSLGKFEICKEKLEKPHSVRNVSFGKFEIYKEKLEKSHSVGMFRLVKKTLGKENNTITLQSVRIAS